MKMKAFCTLFVFLYVVICTPMLAQSNGFSLAAGTNVAYLFSKESAGKPGAYLNATLAKSRFQLGLALTAYSINKQYGDLNVVSDFDHFYFLNTIQGRLSVGYNVLSHGKVGLAPLLGIAIDRRNINTVDTYTTKPGNSQELLTTKYKQQTHHAIGALMGVQSRLVLSRRLSLDLWSHFQRFQDKKPTNIENALFKGNVWLIGLGLAYSW